jgi:hypothetical protein
MGSEDNNKGDEIMLLYHGSPVIVEKPEIRTAKFHKDFYFGFYCTEMETQAKRRAQDLEMDMSINMSTRQIQNLRFYHFRK